MSNFRKNNALLDVTIGEFTPIASSSQQQDSPPNNPKKSENFTKLNRTASNLWSNYMSGDCSNDEEISSTQLSKNVSSSNLFNSKEWNTAHDTHYSPDNASIRRLKRDLNISGPIPSKLVAIVTQLDNGKPSKDTRNLMLNDRTGKIEAILADGVQKPAELSENSVLVLQNFKLLRVKAKFIDSYLYFKWENVHAEYSPKNITRIGCFTQRKKVFPQKLLESQHCDSKLPKTVLNERNTSQSLKLVDKQEFVFPNLDFDFEDDSDNENIKFDKLKKNVDKIKINSNILIPNLELSGKLDNWKENPKKFVFKPKNLNILENSSKQSLENTISCNVSGNNLFLMPDLDFDDINDDESTLKIDVSALKTKKIRLNNDEFNNSTRNSQKIPKAGNIQPISPAPPFEDVNVMLKTTESKTSMCKAQLRLRKFVYFKKDVCLPSKIPKTLNDSDVLRESQITIKTQNPADQPIVDDVFDGLDLNSVFNDF